MSPVASTYWFSGALPVVAIVAISGVLGLAIAAWLVREVARSALERSAQADVPQVLAALTGLLDRLRLFLPWPDRGRHPLPTDTSDSLTTSHTGATKDLPGGGPQ